MFPALALNALLIAVSVWARPLMPIDETRYLAVAWEMWLRGDFLVPYLNGEPYSHKPPLLFWLIHAGWWLFGVNDVWPRLVVPLFALGSLVLTGLIARRLWPDRPGVAEMATLMLVASFYWLVFSTMVMFDMLVVFFVLLGVYGLLRVEGRERFGWSLLLLSVALGALAKGPFAVLFLASVTLAAPLWMRLGEGWLRWYLKAGAAGVAGGMLALAWAIPAAMHGGEQYAADILWGQTAGRVVESFAHQRPVWWYLPVLFAMLLPLTVWRPFWGGMQRIVTVWGRMLQRKQGRKPLICGARPGRVPGRGELNEAMDGFIQHPPGRPLKNDCGGSSAALRGARFSACRLDMSRLLRSARLASGHPRYVFQRPAEDDARIWLLLAWFVPPFVLLSLASGKQPHYLLPLLPVLALFAARAMADALHVMHRPWIAGLGWVLFGALLLIAPLVSRLGGWADDLRGVTLLAGLVPLGFGLWLMWFRRDLLEAAQGLAWASTAGVLAVLVYVSPLKSSYDLSDFSQTLGRLERDGIPLAILGEYRGEYQFMGRLERTPMQLDSAEAATAWCKGTDGKGVVLVTHRNVPVGGMLASTGYRSKTVAAWHCASLPQALAHK